MEIEGYVMVTVTLTANQLEYLKTAVKLDIEQNACDFEAGDQELVNSTAGALENAKEV